MLSYKESIYYKPKWSITTKQSFSKSGKAIYKNVIIIWISRINWLLELKISADLLTNGAGDIGTASVPLLYAFEAVLAHHQVRAGLVYYLNLSTVANLALFVWWTLLTLLLRLFFLLLCTVSKYLCWWTRLICTANIFVVELSAFSAKIVLDDDLAMRAKFSCPDRFINSLQIKWVLALLTVDYEVATLAGKTVTGWTHRLR